MLPTSGAGGTPDVPEAWLEQLGLAKYAPIFSENEVELADLSELTEDDLKE